MSSSDVSLLQPSPLLLVIPSVGAAKDGDAFILDEKMLVGWQYFAKHWPGRTRFVFRETDRKRLTFSKRYEADALPGEIEVIGATADIADETLAMASVVLASGDSFDSFDIAGRARRLNVPVCYIIEYTLGTRLRIEAESSRPLLQRLKSMLWLTMQEPKRRAAFRTASALQANGVPAARAYRSTSPNILTYFDTRLARDMIATDRDVEQRVARLTKGDPLRLIFTGRLEPLKGAHHLIPVARALLELGLDFQLDIYGTGSLQAAIEQAIAGDRGLAAHVEVHRPLDFATRLVPLLRTSPDLFVCCHIQADPSCTYSETLGCGVPIVGYDNEAWRGMLELAEFGWKTKLGDARAMAEKIVWLDRNRPLVAAAAERARDFGHQHCFESVFEMRVRHLMEVAGLPAPEANSSNPHVGLRSIAEI